MKVKDLFSKIKEGTKPFFSHFRILKPNIKSLAFMLLLFILLGIFIFIYDQGYCIKCETGNCECQTKGIIGFGLWSDLAAAALLSYIIITVLVVVLKKYRVLS